MSSYSYRLFQDSLDSQARTKRFFDEMNAQSRDRLKQDERNRQDQRETAALQQRMKEGIQQVMDDSMLNSYVDKLKIKEVDPQAYKFLVLRKKEFWKLRSPKCNQKDLPKQEMRKHVFPYLGLISGLTLSLFLPFTGIASSAAFGSCMSIYAGSWCAILVTEHYQQEQEADSRAISKANVEELKGGMRFFKVCQKVHQLRDRIKYDNGGFFNRLFLSINSSFERFSSISSEKNWLLSLAMDPSWKDRITKIEKELQVRGEDISAMQEDQEKIALLEKFV